MRERGVITIDIDTARKWYKSEDKSLRQLARHAFTIKELEESNLPKSWDEYYNQKEGNLPKFEDNFIYSQNLLLLHKLLMLRDAYRRGWKPRWKDKSLAKWVITLVHDELQVTWSVTDAFIMSFPRENLAEQFLENFRTELEQLKELL